MGLQKPATSFLLGWPALNPTAGPLTLTLSASATYLGLGFVLSEAQTLNKVKFRAFTVSGSLGVNDTVCELYSGSAIGQPGTLIESRNTVTAIPTANTWVEATGFTTALSAHTQYFIVIRNANGTPATNNFSVVFGGSNWIPQYAGYLRWGWSKWQSADSGATWGTGVDTGSNLRLEFSGGLYAGFPINNVLTSSSLVYSNREYGVRFTTPNNVRIIVRGIGMRLTTNLGTPTQDPYFKLYTGSTPSLLASTGTFPRGATTSSSGWSYGYFSQAYTIEPGTILRAVLAETTQSDAASNAFRITEYNIENDVNSKALFPLGGLQRSYFDGSSWSDSDTAFPAFALLPDTDGEFAVSGGGLLTLGGMTGGMHQS